MESFYCEVVGAEITTEICGTRKKQAQSFRDKNDPHASLEKCMICEKIEALAEEVQEVAEDWGKQDKEALICAHCKRPPGAIKSKWIKKRSMHVSCYQQITRTGKPQEEKILCIICKRPPEALKSVWIKKRQMHHTCYNNQNTRGETKKPQTKRGLKHYSFPKDNIDSLMIENIKLKTIIETIDKYAPVADHTCTDPGISFSEAVRRSLIDDKHVVFINEEY
jgi:hypothetical protein